MDEQNVNPRHVIVGPPKTTKVTVRLERADGTEQTWEFARPHNIHFDYEKAIAQVSGHTRYDPVDFVPTGRRRFFIRLECIDERENATFLDRITSRDYTELPYQALSEREQR